MMAEVEEVKVFSNDAITDIEKIIYQFPLLETYCKKKNAGWNIGQLFNDMRVQKIALYSITRFAELVAKDLKSDDNIEIINIADSDSSKAGEYFQGVYTITLEELIYKYEKHDIEYIIICNIFYAQEIMRDLINNGIAQRDVMTITELLCW